MTLSGYKTYIVVVCMILYAGTGYMLGHISADEAVRLIMEAAGLGALRAGISKGS